MMQKDEGELLRAWIDHHLEITSPELIYIFDNGSTCRKTQKILKIAKKNGINISLEYNSRKDFERKGEIICKTIQFIQANNKSDFIIPLDCDEFLGIQSDTNTDPSFDHSSISQHLGQLIEQEGYFKVKRHYFNHTHEPDIYHINNAPGKYFFGSSSLKSLDVGFHSPKLNEESCQNQCHNSGLIAFHYHNKAFSIRRANAINKMRSRVNNFLINDLKQYSGLGMHLLKDLRGIDTPFAPPTQYRTRSFLDHVQNSGISFPHNLYQEECLIDQMKGQRIGRYGRKKLSRLRRSLQSNLNQFNQFIPSHSGRERVRLQTASADIKGRYQTSYASLKQLKKAIKNYSIDQHITNNPGTTIITIRNNRSLANAYLATFIASHRQNIVFDCRNFWSNTDTQLLTLTSSAIQAHEGRVILRHELKCNKKIHKQLIVHFLMIASHQPGRKNKGRYSERKS